MLDWAVIVLNGIMWFNASLMLLLLGGCCFPAVICFLDLKLYAALDVCLRKAEYNSCYFTLSLRVNTGRTRNE